MGALIEKSECIEAHVRLPEASSGEVGRAVESVALVVLHQLLGNNLSELCHTSLPNH